MQKILLPTPDAPPKRGGIARYIGATLRARSDVELLMLKEEWGTGRVFLCLLRSCHPEGALRRPKDLLDHESHSPNRKSLFQSSFGRLNISLRMTHFSSDAPRRIWTHHIFPIGTVCYLLSVVFPLSYTVFLHGLDFDLARRNAWKRFLAKRILHRAAGIVTNSHALQKEVAEFAQRDDVRVVYPCVSHKLKQASATTRKGLAHRTPEELMKLLASAMLTTAGVGVSMRGGNRSVMPDPDPAPIASWNDGSRVKPGMTETRLLTVARLVERKGHAKVIRALKDLPHVTYTIVGDGPSRESLQEIAKQEGVADRVSFLTTVTDDQLPDLYTAHDIFVMPTTKSLCDREGFGIVYAEAGLFGLPCIATDISGVNEVIENDVTGLLISDAQEALCEAIRKLVSSPGLRSRMGSAARRRVLERFTEEKFCDAIREISSDKL